MQLKDSGGTANGGVDTSTAKTFSITVTPAAPTIPSAVGVYNGTLVIPAVGHNRAATMTITSQSADGSFVGSLVSSTVSVDVTGKVAANGTFTISMATPTNTPHPGGPINGTGTGTLPTAVGQQIVLSLMFVPNMPGTLTVIKV